MSQFLLGDAGWVVAPAGGTSSVSWPGGSATSYTTSLAHGLGSLPKSADACANAVPYGLVMWVVTFDATDIYVTAVSVGTPSGGTTLGFNWIAIG